ncbi:phage shock protein A [Clostridia bacterium]|nr:phage shock protein A [Clostridia bacterium]
MAILQRFSEIIQANINALLDKAEDPVKMADQYLIRYKENFAKVKENTAKVIAERNKLARQISDKEQETAKRGEQAKQALVGGREDLAKKAIEEKQRLEAELVKLRDTHATFSEQVAQLESDYNSLANAIRDLESKRDMIKAKAAVNQAQKATQKTGVAAKSMGNVGESLDRLEGKLDSELEVNRAYKELDKGLDRGLAELDEFTTGALSADAELKRMKEELGLE